MADSNSGLYRRHVLALASTAIASLSGCLGFLGFGDDSDNSDQSNGDTPNNPQPDGAANPGPERDGNDSENETTEPTSSNETDTESDNESEEMPEAANPEPEDNSPNESAYEGNTSQSSEPTKDDITITKHSLSTDTTGATVNVALRNDWHDVIEVLDLEVVFKKNGSELTTVTWGTNNLRPGEKWTYPFRADGKEYSSATDYDIYVVNVQ